MQMGVEVASVSQPLSANQRATLRRIEQVTPYPGTVQGTGSAYVISHQVNASFAMLNELLSGGGQAGFSKTETKTPAGMESGAIILSGLDSERVASLARKHSINALAVARAPVDAISTKKPRLGLYRSWSPVIDEGWTRWILENYGFAPVTLRNGDIQAGHLRDRFDAIIIPDQSPREIIEGYNGESIRPEYRGGIGEVGVENLARFVSDGGTLITLGAASDLAIDRMPVPVRNVKRGLRRDQHDAPGTIFRVQIDTVRF